jgi:hypothetical protein
MYSRTITNDTYFALNYGLVPFNVKDLAENTSFLSKEENCYRNCYLSNEDNYSYASIATMDSNVFSDADVTTLESIYQQFGNCNPFELSDISHHYPEWKKFETHLQSNTSLKVTSHKSRVQKHGMTKDYSTFYTSLLF